MKVKSSWRKNISDRSANIYEDLSFSYPESDYQVGLGGLNPPLLIMIAPSPDFSPIVRPPTSTEGDRFKLYSLCTNLAQPPLRRLSYNLYRTEISCELPWGKSGQMFQKRSLVILGEYGEHLSHAWCVGKMLDLHPPVVSSLGRARTTSPLNS